MGVYRERTGAVMAWFWGPTTVNRSHCRSVSWALLLQMGRLQELCMSEMTHTLGLLVTCLLWTPSKRVHCSMILKAFRYKKSVFMSRYL